MLVPRHLLAATIVAALPLNPCRDLPSAYAAEPAAEVDSVDRDYSADLPRLPPVPVDKALATFQVEPGFKLELAAAEPLITDPVALDFDEQGRVYVVEMLGYSEDADSLLGRVRVLVDSDRDGAFDSSTVLIDGLAWPTAVLCYDGGAFIGAAPDLLYVKDADGDGRAEIREVVFTGFGTDNVQGLLNSFRWGLDNRIHVAVSRCGADLRYGEPARPGPGPNADGSPAAAPMPLVLRGRNFAFDPKTREVQATSGASQHGFDFDPHGNAFTCQNSDHIQQILLDDAALSRNPLMRPPAALVSIAAEGPAADVFRISPVEPWREIRTRLRAKGIVPGLVEGGGRAAGYFTSATGATIYTGDAWPAEFHGNAFIGDVGSNLVHRKTIHRQDDAVPLVARRATPDREFIASTDTWYRPVQFANGPDGNLYVLDMYREVIEHPASLPPVIKKHLDLTSGRDRGRLYRVVRADRSEAQRREHLTRALPGDASTDELVALLNHPNGWHRTTAARLLYQRNDTAAFDALRTLFGQQEAPVAARLAALYALQTAGQVNAAGLRQALADDQPAIREHAARLASRWLLRDAKAAASERPDIERTLAALADDPVLHVRFEAAMALGDCQGPERIPALASIVRRNVGDAYVAAAALSSLAAGGDQLLAALAADGAFASQARGRAFLLELARQIGARGAENETGVLATLAAQPPADDASLAGELLVAALDGAGANRQGLRQQLAAHADGASERIIVGMLERSIELAANEEAAVADRTAAIAALPLAPFDEASPLLVELLAPRQPQEVQSAALTTLQVFSEAEVATAILEAWPGMSPALRLQASAALLSRAGYAAALLEAIEQQAISPRDLDPSTIQQLKTHAAPAVREKAAALLDVAAPQRADVVEAHLDALQLAGDAGRGRETFRKHCAICHRKEDHGTEVGADLATVVTRTPEALLIAVLDPNREVDPRYVQYNILTVDGLAKSGMIAGETAASITLKREQNVTETVPRADVESLESTGMTLMPEGFEKVIDKQSLADLLAYLRTP